MAQAEFTFALLKVVIYQLRSKSQFNVTRQVQIALIIILIVGGLVVELGGAPNHDRIGFRSVGPYLPLQSCLLRLSSPVDIGLIQV
jgi:hypothetical protein